MRNDKPDIRSWKDIADEETKLTVASCPIRTPAGIGHLVNAMYATTKLDYSDAQKQLNHLAFLVGIACSCLGDYSDILESRGHVEYPKGD